MKAQKLLTIHCKKSPILHAIAFLFFYLSCFRFFYFFSDHLTIDSFWQICLPYLSLFFSCQSTLLAPLSL